MNNGALKLVVEGYLHDGRLFRPSDWMERIATVVAGFGPDHRLRYANAVQPRMIKGEKYLIVDQSLKMHNPIVYDYIVNFVHSNGLRCHEQTWSEKEY